MRFGKMARSDGRPARAYALLAVTLLVCACKPAPNEASKGVTVDLPPALPADAGNGSETAQNAVVSAAPPAAPVTDAKTEAVKPTPEAKPDKETPAPTAATVPAKPDEAVDDAKLAPPPAAAEAKSNPSAAEPKPGVAKPPLSNAGIAGTIERIGYPCGSVVSASHVESSGSEQTYKIICSSGDSYRGTSRSGHMRFRKWSGN